MAKKNKKKAEASKAPETKGGNEDEISSRGFKTILCGIGVLICGFWILTLTDPAGRNWASNFSPFLILGGYGIIALGIFLPDPSEEARDLGSRPPPPSVPPAA